MVIKIKNNTLIVLLCAIFICRYVFGDLPLNAADNIFKEHRNSANKIALTFDDGPHRVFTGQILDILQKHNIKATFFVVGKNVKRFPGIVKRMVDGGHEVGNHSFSHDGIYSISEHNLIKELRATEEAIYEASDYRPKLYRPPEGRYTGSIVDTAVGMDYCLILWTVDTRDWSKRSNAQGVADIATSNIRSGSIILCHDFMSKKVNPTIEALDIMIPQLKEMGYQFVTVSELIMSR